MKTKATIEHLEARIAPAMLTGQVLTYADMDGDKVTVTISKALLAAGMFTFDTGFRDGDTTTPQQLQRIDLAFGGIAPSAGANITTQVIRADHGDGLVNIGAIVDDDDLGSVTIHGDLGGISCGDGTTAPGFGLKSLSVQSLGRFGTATGEGALVNGDGTLESHIRGGLGALKVKGDVANVWLHVTGAGAGDELHGTIGSIAIGGSLIGGSTLRAGTIDITGDMGPVKIGHDIQGGTFMSAGSLQSDYGKIKSVTLGGSLIGRSATFTGEIRSGSDLGPVKIAGNVQGGAGAVSGFIASITGFGTGIGNIASITIGGSLLGGAGSQSGQIQSPGDIGPVKIGHDVRGGSGDESAKIDAGGSIIPAGPATGRIASLTIGGSLVGGGGNYDTFTDGNNVQHTAQIFSVGDMGMVTIGGSIVGGAGKFSARIASHGALAGLSVHESIVGNAASTAFVNASVGAIGSIGPVKIGGSILGGAGASASIESTMGVNGGRITSVTVGGSVVGGAGSTSGRILAGGLGSDSFLGPVRIGGDLIGGAGGGSGTIASNNAVTSVTIGGSMIGGTGGSSGGISVNARLGPVKIGRDLVGGSISGSAALAFSGFISATTMTSVAVGGSIFAGVDNSSTELIGSGSIVSSGAIGKLAVKGSVVGSVGASGDITPVVISAPGGFPSQGKNPMAIGSLSVGGRVEHAMILGGYQNPGNLAMPHQIGTPINPDAQIGKVTVGGDWIASSLAAGVTDGGDGFGNAGDGKINSAADDPDSFSRIASITIKGIVTGTTGPGDHFGFVAQQIGSFKAAGFTAHLTSDTDPAIELAPATADMTVREV